MFHLLYKRYGSDSANCGIKLENEAVSLGRKFKKLHEETALLIMNKRRGLVKQASSKIIMIDVDLSGGADPVNPVTAIDHQIGSSHKEFKNELGWTLEKPKDGDFRGILLSSEKPSISSVAEKFNCSDFIIEDFDLGDRHSWKRMF